MSATSAETKAGSRFRLPIDWRTAPDCLERWPLVVRDGSLVPTKSKSAVSPTQSSMPSNHTKTELSKLRSCASFTLRGTGLKARGLSKQQYFAKPDTRDARD